ncbi:caspase family protein [Parasedimentitalea marina]|uniref:Caspase family protein n=1 Tax=Parasedimentitalea marina TaxID=2483033 RepID=A0A3T0N7F2_9RHOB|nr:caspase family protein [Parasedimentitalea marina]AZV79882.1 caspase family protein [Parasedimentitalea marina]
MLTTVFFRKYLCWLAAIFCASVLPLQAQAGGRYALLIGNQTYEHGGTLSNPVNDTALLEQSFAAMGFEVETLTDATQDVLGDAIDRLSERYGSADTVAVYYSGHGLQKDGRNFLVPVDARITSSASIERETISMDSLIEVLKPFPISMIFLDACRDNPFAANLQAGTSVTKSVAQTRGLAVMRAEGDMLITYATLPNTTASDGMGNNSPFASALARHIRTPDTEISVLMKRVTGDVVAETRGQQRPQQISQMQTEFYFKRTPNPTTITDPLRALLAVYPQQVTAGEEVSVVADVPPSCTPFFADFAPDGHLTPIPLQFFKSIALSNGQIRYEISPGSRFGLMIQETDALGTHQLGLVCEPKEIGGDKAAVRTVMAEVATKVKAGELAGFVTTGGYEPVEYRFERFTIQ